MVKMKVSLEVLVLGLGFLVTVRTRIFERCEFNYELNKTGIINDDNLKHISKWLCISDWSTSFNTSYHNKVGDIETSGILKISHDWCDGGACNIGCDQLRDDDITETVKCANLIFQTEGDSFEPWFPVWQTNCRDVDTTNYTRNCTDDITFISQGGEIEENEGTENFKLACTVTSYPAPTVSWVFDGEEEVTHIQEITELVDVFYTSRLIFDEILLTDAKIYSCEVSNGDGETAIQNVTLIVHPHSTDSSTSSTGTTETEPDGTEKTETTTEDTSTSNTTLETSSTNTETTTEGINTSDSSSVPTTMGTTLDPLVPTPPPGPPKIYGECELAKSLTRFHSDVFDWNGLLEEWLCLSDKTSGFNGSYLVLEEKTVFYGIFKISNKWCTDGYNTASPCQIHCNDLFDPDLTATVSCSQHIYNQTNSFDEWSEFAEECEGNVTNYLANCAEKPFFVSENEDDLNKVFEEFSEWKTITCSAQGFPPPDVKWDENTQKVIEASDGRLFLTFDRLPEENGNVTVTSTITISQVWMEDEGLYLCNASNIAGWESRSILLYVQVVGNQTASNSALIYGGSALIGLLLIAALILAYWLWKARRQRKKALERLYKEFIHGSDATTISEGNQTLTSYLSDFETYERVYGQPFNKHFEILPHSLEVNFDFLLGSGAFGMVMQGLLEGKGIVAVKSVPKGATEAMLAALLSEVKILSYVGKHPNIVEFLGAQTIDLRRGKIYVVMEFCSNGSLESILHRKREQLEQRNYRRQYNVKYTETTFLPGYMQSPAVAYNPRPFSRHQLLQFCHQVSCGMEYLAFKKIIHGDLSSRNVLVTSDFVCKITDFGLARQLYESGENFVTAEKGMPLPWRWLAIESLKENGRFSTESDIWSYGVFMWEVFSLAELPYSTAINWTPEFVSYLEQGFRLAMPKYASKEIFEVMLKCWKMEPTKRIAFGGLSVSILKLLETEGNRGRYES